jgi:hypothetical protein
MADRSRTKRINVSLSGKQLAALNGALTVLCSWPFEKEAARAIAAKVCSDDAQRFAEEVGECTRLHFESCGLWPGESPWTVELITRRARTTLRMDLLEPQLTIAVAALRAAAEEFKDRWWEFGVVAPGGLDLYEVREKDLRTWADSFAARLRKGRSR